MVYRCRILSLILDAIEVLDQENIKTFNVLPSISGHFPQYGLGLDYNANST